MGRIAWEQGQRRKVWEYLLQLTAWQCRAFCGLKSRGELRDRASRHSVPASGLTWKLNFSPAGCPGAVSQGQGKDVSHVSSEEQPRPHAKAHQAAGSSWSPQRGQAAALFLQEEDPRGPMHPTLPSLPQQLPGREHPLIPWAPALPHTGQHLCLCPQTGVTCWIPQEREQG